MKFSPKFGMKFCLRICAVFAVLVFCAGCEAKKSVSAAGNSGGGGVFTGFSINAW
ncbi:MULTISPECIES: hypothetical protein [unclassified Campylobacter]|uniref:hypothetical protein n=1 Tax=unclassified Campylobacter TaxID=2593542 RepID=UPI0022E9B0A9|nr:MULTISPECIES: hypothetical protein [unclassified Campylobacter]MDA3049302.1 hypothetical protein [Campylobacter sp. JMF_15 NE4]MDA3062493.1 hypothetical protein [Campylobacter sp. JMF_14 EL1]MDA3073389.1 hypothetical protein [Campylobacter sp. JMF_10 EL2]